MNILQFIFGPPLPFPAGHNWGGENLNPPFQLSFNPSLRVDFQGSRVTSDGGLVLVRELDERLGFSDLIARHLTDSRAKNTQLPLADLLRQSIYSRMAGYEDVNDTERLAQDPNFPVDRLGEDLGANGTRVASSSAVQRHGNQSVCAVAVDVEVTVYGAGHGTPAK